MKNKQTLAHLLLKWYKKNARQLPWRKTSDPYKIWISEIMLQQTTVNAVIPYYKKWIKEFPTIKHVARARQQKILKMWQGLGYYSRVKNIHKSANIIVNKYDAKIPREAQVLKKLPGFGPYTVGAVLSIAYNIRYPIIDANVRRVLMRLMALKGIADTSKDEAIYRFLEEKMPNKCIGDFNQALMELGALICRSREPVCLLCPVRIYCQAHKKGIQEIIPESKKRAIKDIDVAIGILSNNGRFFIQKRPSKGLLADLWEFPGGKVEKGESKQEALRRELKEEIGIQISSAKRLMQVQHFYTQYRVKLHVYQCESKNTIQENVKRKWVHLSELSKYPMPSGSVKIVEKLRS